MTSPTEIKQPVIMLSAPEFAWEIVGHKVNEGPAVLKRNGRIFVTYSASATDHNYAMGLLWADAQADLLDPAVWHKSPEPVFYTNAEVGRFGPGHNSFTVAEDGVTDLMVYHARDYRDIDGDPLNDPNRHTRVRVLHWDEQGMPDFRQRQGD
jgi:GH43 family beta-xylosidase